MFMEGLQVGDVFTDDLSGMVYQCALLPPVYPPKLIGDLQENVRPLNEVAHIFVHSWYEDEWSTEPFEMRIQVKDPITVHGSARWSRHE